jgi:hypothetical protein
MIVDRAPQLSRGVQQLQYVGDAVATGSLTDGPCFEALKTGLVVMGIASLLGVSSETARWAGVAAVGVSLLRR